MPTARRRHGVLPTTREERGQGPPLTLRDILFYSGPAPAPPAHRRRGAIVNRASFFPATLALAFLALCPRASGAGQAPASHPGRAVYLDHCAICHGAAGDGEGMAAHMFMVRPRDFGRGVFKFRSTPSGSLPTDEDLARTIRRGLPGSAMLPHDHLTD